MGREIRRVPADWVHPKYTDYDGLRDQVGQYIPLHDDDYVAAAKEWIEAATAAGFRYAWNYDRAQTELDNGCQNVHHESFYWEYDSPPDPEHYRARVWTEEEATHYQVYENVSEGTPVTPVFATLQELEDHLVNVGDDWGDKYSRAAAKAFCKEGSAFSLVIDGGRVMNGIEALAEEA